MAPSCKDIKIGKHEPTKIYTVISPKRPHKICAVNTNGFVGFIIIRK